MTAPTVLVLLAARLRSRGSFEAVGQTFAELGGDPSEFPALLQEAERLDQVRCRGEEQRRSLTGAGEAELAAHLAAETTRVGRADLGTAYEAFLPLNREFLAALSVDAALSDLDDLVTRLRPVLRALVGRLDRFAGYERRFATALAAAAHDPDWVASPRVDSVHTIWFELHEHLLATLGRDRTQEHPRSSD
jgi:hypothetical protein